MTRLNTKYDEESKCELEQDVEELAELSKTNFEKFKDDLDKAKLNKGRINSKQIWKLKKRLCTRSNDPSTDMLDSRD